MSNQNTTQNTDQPVEATPPAGSTIPESDIGVGVGYTGEPSTFEPEEALSTDSSPAPAGDAPTATAYPGAEAAGGTGPRSTEATAMTGEELSIFRTHWDEFAGQAS